MPFIPHTETDVKEMLAAIKAPSIEALFDEIPPALRCGALEKIPEGLSEMAVTQLMQQRAQADSFALNFIGAGAYEHHIPAAVWEITTRGEFYSRSEEHTSELQSLMRISYAVFCLKKKKKII